MVSITKISHCRVKINYKTFLNYKYKKLSFTSNLTISHVLKKKFVKLKVELKCYILNLHSTSLFYHRWMKGEEIFKGPNFFLKQTFNILKYEKITYFKSNFHCSEL